MFELIKMQWDDLVWMTGELKTRWSNNFWRWKFERCLVGTIICTRESEERLSVLGIKHWVKFHFLKLANKGGNVL